MARINFPTTFAEQRTLLDLIKAKHDADGTASVLTPYLLQKGISLNNDVADGEQAQIYDKEQKKLIRQAENEMQQRNRHFDGVFERTRGEVQFLKSFYAPNTRMLGEWGVTVTHQNRIKYPSDFLSRVVLVRAIKTTHDSYDTTAAMLNEDDEEILSKNGEVALNVGAAAAITSPLEPYLVLHNININADALNVDKAEVFHNDFLATSRNAEEATQLRNNLWHPVIKNIKDMSNYLKKLYNNSEKTLGEWGITVDNSPPLPKERISTVLQLGKKQTRGVKIGSTFTNIGTVELHIYKGALKKGKYVVVPASEAIAMTKGYSVITVFNPSPLVKGKYRILLHR